MIKIYYFIFLRLYRLAERTEKQWGSLAMPEWTALYSTTFIICLHAILSLAIVERLTSVAFFSNLEGMPYYILIFGIGVGILNYFIFLKNSSYKRKIVDTEKLINKRYRFTINFIFWLYICLIASLLIFLVESRK